MGKRKARMPKGRHKKPFKRFMACLNCSREIVVTKGHWTCPYCGADCRPVDHRGKSSLEDTGIATTRKRWDTMIQFGVEGVSDDEG